MESLPDLDSKFYAATQTMDEARHVETFAAVLDKIGVVYPINPQLQGLLDFGSATRGAAGVFLSARCGFSLLRLRGGVLTLLRDS